MKKLIVLVTTTLLGMSGALVSAHNGEVHLSQEAVTWAHDSGITKYDTVSSFMADVPVTREQAAKMIATWLGSANMQGVEIPMNDIGCVFNDKSSIDSTLSYHVELACQYGLFKGYKGNFMPRNYITAADVNTLISRATSLAPSFAASYSYPTVKISGSFLTRGELLHALYSADMFVSAWLNEQENTSLQTAQANLNAAKTLWSSQSSAHYSATQQASCFCTEEWRSPVTFDVMSGVVVSGSVQYVSGTNMSNPEFLPEPMTVEEMFALIQNAIDEKADAITVTYDATLGYPKELWVDYSKMMADEEMSYTYSVVKK